MPAAAASPVPPGLAALRAGWGVHATLASRSPYTGRGIRIALIDSGFQPPHPDFRARQIVGHSFVPGEDPLDGVGHGTHCGAVACGPIAPVQYPRYGIAGDAEMWVFKVLGRDGTATPAALREAVETAIRYRCDIVSMPIGQPVSWSTPYDADWERLGQQALASGTLILAAAGDESNRPFNRRFPVDHPANCPSFVAVAAVDQNLAVADFSNGGPNAAAAGVDIAAPGVDVFSAHLPTAWYRELSGTSQATAFAAGIAALHAEKTGLRGAALRAELLRTARALTGDGHDIGAGLVQAPL